MTTTKETFEPKPAEIPEEEKGTFELLQEGISKTSREIWLAGLGVFSTIDKEGTRLFSKFVERGRGVVENGKAMAAKKNGEPAPTYVGEKVDQFTHDILARLDDAAQYVQKKIFPSGEPEKASRSELHELTDRVEKLTNSVAALVQKMDDKDKFAPKMKPAL
jgi:poly(hydroxyalkanoate) granule-associated protein